MRNKSFLSLKDIAKNDLENLIESGISFKKQPTLASRLLEKKYLGLLFSVPSTRTRMSFQKAIFNLGGESEYFSYSDLQLKNGESLEDTAQIISQYMDGLIVRNYDMNLYGQGHQTLESLNNNSTIPIINALDEIEHPTQVLADLVTLKSRWKHEFNNKSILLTWGYSRRQKSLGVPHSWLCAAGLLGLNLKIAYPQGFDLDERYTSYAEKLSKSAGTKIEYSNNLAEAAVGVDCIYVKNWKSLSLSSEKENNYKNQIKNDWCVTQEIFDKTNPGAVYMDCLPSIINEESTGEVRYGKNSIIFQQAATRLFANQAILKALFS